MGEPFVGEIRVFAGNFVPLGWAFCNGQLLPIAENAVLFNLIGTTYGGDGQQTFALPDMQCRALVHQGANFVIGQKAGVENVTLIQSNLPAHSHTLMATNTAGTSASPGPGVALASSPTGEPIYDNGTTNPTTLAPQAVGVSGSGAPHVNRQPYLGVSYIISLFGIYPSQN
jgi:microcystin-dependent protein